MKVSVIVQKLRIALKRRQGRFLTSSFPQTPMELDSFINLTLSLGGFPETYGYRSLVAQSVLHATQGQAALYPNLIVLEIKRAQANAIAYGVIEDVKRKEKAAKDVQPV